MLYKTYFYLKCPSYGNVEKDIWTEQNMIRNLRFLSLVLLLVFASGIYAVPPPRGIDPLEAKRKARIDKIKREKARRDSINCYLRERKKISDGGTTCIYKCPSVKGRVESNNIGPGFSCPTMMNVLRRE